jgi:hypothetical protein
VNGGDRILAPDGVEKAIFEMLEQWQARHDERALRGALGRLIAGL